MSAYIDVRGPWPVFIKGLIAIELRGGNRCMTLFDAKFFFNCPVDEKEVSR